MLYTTARLAEDNNVCSSSYKKMTKALGKDYGIDTLIPLTKILEVCGLNDTLWVLQFTTDKPAADKLARLFVCDYAWHVLKFYEREYPKDKRIRNCIKVSRRFANGLATDAELLAAQSAAESAAWSAAESAAQSAAESAAWSAAWSAAESAAWSAAAAESAAWLAAAAVWSATESAAAAEIEWQTKRLWKLLEVKC